MSDNAVIPSYSKVGDAGMDLTITSVKENTTFDVSYGFGISMEIPKNLIIHFKGLFIFRLSFICSYSLL